MPAIPAAALRQIIVNALASGNNPWTVPGNVQGRTTLTVMLGGTPRKLDVAIRTLTRDTRQVGDASSRLKLQLTGLEGVAQLDAILGVRSVGNGVVIVGVDPKLHLPVQGRSTNVQVPEQAVIDADQQQGFVKAAKSNGEVLTSFPDGLLEAYLLGGAVLGAPAPIVAAAGSGGPAGHPGGGAPGAGGPQSGPSIYAGKGWGRRGRSTPPFRMASRVTTTGSALRAESTGRCCRLHTSFHLR